MRILFYLPAITPWWFEQVVAPMLVALDGAAELHVIAPEPWSGTGIGDDELNRCGDLPDINWHLIGGPDHPSLRTRPRDPQPLIDFVRQLAPDHVICRSADRDTPRAFPGRVHYLMEGGVAPLALSPTLVWLAEDLFDHGMAPPLAPEQAALLSGWLAPVWDRLRASLEPQPAALPQDSRLNLLLPLEYEHPENVFLMHRPGPTPNSRLVADLVARLPDSVRLVLTDHPLNLLHVDGSALQRTVADLSDRVTLLDEGVSTAVVARACDGMIVGDSKAFGVAAFWRKPFHRATRFRSADWLDPYDDLDALVADLTADRARAPRAEEGLVWAAYHLANNVFDPQAPDFHADTVLERLARPVDPGRWPANMARASAAWAGTLQ